MTTIKPVRDSYGRTFMVSNGSSTLYRGTDFTTAAEIFAKHAGRELSKQDREQLWDDAQRLSSDRFASVRTVR